MKNWLKKCSVALLIFSMIGTTMPVYAADAGTAEEQTTEYEQTEENVAKSDVEESRGEEQTLDAEESVDESNEGEAEQEETEQEVQTEENSMNYVYVESPYLETPDTQRVAVSWGDGSENIEQMLLHVQKDDGSQDEWTVSRSEGKLYLFEKVYEDEQQSGIYEVTSISVTEDGETTDYTLKDLGMEAKFGVNQEYDGIDELRPLDESTDEDAVDVSVAKINGDGTMEEQDSIVDALQSAAEDVLASTPATMSADNGISTYSDTGRSGKIVVALDPGHDNRDAGASANGLKEEVLTLKIANYCKAELEQYYGVEVYMTRTSSACPYPSETPAGGCITARANAAAKAGAKIFVSFHLNAAATTAAYGAEVIIPNYNWRADVGAQGRELASNILNELTALGLYNRGLYYKTGTDPEYTYPDGSLEDWFTVQVANKYNGIPGIIVEHAFITNNGDVNNVLNTEAGLKRLGVADATGIAKYLGLSKEKVEWKTVNGKTYCYINNQKVTGERLIGGYWYYFDGNGVMQTGFVNLGSKIVYYNADGQMQYGEKCINGSWYYFNTVTGARTTGFYNLPGKTVYYNADGKMLYGEQKIGKHYYYFDPVYGSMYTGWKTIDKKTRYYQENGQSIIGEGLVNGKWYYFDENGIMQTGFVNLGSKIVYYNSHGQMQYGEQCINGSWYYFDKVTGKMATGFFDLPEKTVYYNSDGKMLHGEQKIEKYYYYFDPVYGSMYTGWKTVDKKTRYYQKNGQSIVGEGLIDGKWYYFDKNGIMQTGFVNLGSRTVYYNSHGQMQYGEQCINGSWYYFDKVTGKMATGFYDLPEKKVYYNSNGQMQYGEQCINGSWYYFDKITGKMVTGFYDLPEKKVYYNSNGQMQYEEQCINGSWYYFDKVTGKMATGFYDLPEKKVYYNSNGQMQYEEQCINGSWYYFDKVTGKMATGFYDLPEKTVYYNSKGQMQYGEQCINGFWYYFDKITGKMATGFYDLPEKTVYYNSDGKMLYKEQKIGNDYYYFDAITGAMTKNATINGNYYNSEGKRVEKRQEASHLIVNNATTNITQMVRFYKNTGKVYPTEKLKKGGAESIEKFASIYYEEAMAEGVDPAVAWCQSMKETGWLQFGGQVKIEQFNFAGLGATDNGAAGADFSKYGENGVRMGVRAQIQHLKAYAVSNLTEKDLKYVCVDPRFSLVNKGSAKYVEWLGAQENPTGAGWATGAEYGLDIVKLMNQLEK